MQCMAHPDANTPDYTHVGCCARCSLRASPCQQGACRCSGSQICKRNQMCHDYRCLNPHVLNYGSVTRRGSAIDAGAGRVPRAAAFQARPLMRLQSANAWWLVPAWHAMQMRDVALQSAEVGTLETTRSCVHMLSRIHTEWGDPPLPQLVMYQYRQHHINTRRSCHMLMLASFH